MRLYIAGPMKNWSGNNFPAFKKAQALLENEGYTVISPVDLEVEGADFAETFHRDLTAICLEVDGVVVLPAWETSDGASIEAMTARRVGKPVWELSVILLYGRDGATLGSHESSE